MAFALTDLTGSYLISANAKIYVGGVELKGFKSGSISISGNTVDNTTRDDGGWSKSMPGLRSATLDLTYNKYPDDTTSPTPVTTAQMGIAAQMIAAQGTWSNKGFEIIVLDGNGADTPVYSGFKGTFVLTSYGESQTAGDDGGGQAIEVSASFSNFGPIVSCTAPPSTNEEEEKEEEEEEKKIEAEDNGY